MALPIPGRTAPCVSPQPAVFVAIPTLGGVRPILGYDGGPGIIGGNQGHGININGRQIDDEDSDDNNDQEVNDTNIDPVSPCATGRLEEE